MALRYPFFLIIISIGIIIYFIINKKKKENYTIGSKIANTNYIKNSNYYKKKVKEFNLIKKIIYIIFGCSIIACTILISRLVKISIIEIYFYVWMFRLQLMN